MRRPPARSASPRILALGLLAVALLPHAGGAGEGSVPPPAIRRAALDESSVATLLGGDEIFLEALAGPRDSYVSLALKFAGSELHWAAIERANEGRRPAPGLFYAIPFQVLTGEYRARAIMALFPADGPGEDGWVHRVPEGDEGQRLESVALWFTGDVNLADDLAESNGLAWAPLPAGAEIVIPAAVLVPDLVRALAAPPPPPAPPSPVPPGPTVPRKPSPPVRVGDLNFIDDESGGYAVYRLKPGEALYSSVVVRFTGRLDPGEVAELARRIAELSGIREPTAIPIGHAVRIPRDLILPEFLPPGDPERARHDAGLAAARRHRITAQARGLEGVTLILDSGHGGDDVGAQRNGVHEDDYVYDVLCRVKALAERNTAARVLATIKDRSGGYQPLDGPFSIDRDEIILTRPPYSPRQPEVGTVGVNLRWYLVNSYYRSAIASGADPERVVFISIHADSRHPSVRGAMVYVPGQAHRGRTFGCVGRPYRRREVEELRYIRFTPGERERSEGVSRRLAGQVIHSFQAAGLAVHPYEPIRDQVIRMRRVWSPAVIRTSLVPQSILVEVANLNNAQDAGLMKDPGFRQSVAQALIDALRRQYGDAPPSRQREARSAH